MKPGKVEAIELGKDVKLEMVLIPAGKFMMGSTKKELEDLRVILQKAMKKLGGKVSDVDSLMGFQGIQHEVTLTEPYNLGKYEVTQEQWEAVMGDNPSFLKGAKLPVMKVSWEDCQKFIKKLNAKTNGGYRLPTEAEWEYACRAGTTTAYSFGDEITPKDTSYKNYADLKALKPVGAGPKAVGSYKPNAFGLYDMHGSAWEYCEDWYGPYPLGSVTDPKGLATAERRVMRGGAFVDFEWLFRSSFRNNLSPTDRDGYNGFRLARTN